MDCILVRDVMDLGLFVWDVIWGFCGEERM